MTLRTKTIDMYYDFRTGILTEEAPIEILAWRNDVLNEGVVELPLEMELN